MGEGTGKKKIRRKDGDGKVRLGKHKADHKSNDFATEVVGPFLFLCLRQTAFLRATGGTTAEIKHKKFVGYVEYRA